MDPRLMEKVKKALEAGDRKSIKTWARRSTITPEMVGLTFDVHNGRTFLPVLCTESMVGHKLGEFSFTRKFSTHSSKKGKEASAESKS